MFLILFQPPPTTPASGEVKSLTHRFAIQNGKVRDNTSDFMTFKQHYCLTWGRLDLDYTKAASRQQP